MQHALLIITTISIITTMALWQLINAHGFVQEEQLPQSHCSDIREGTLCYDKPYILCSS